jgi:hypothetical protein
MRPTVIATEGKRMADMDPASLRSQAQRYRKLAAQEDDPQIAALLEELADAFERDAEPREAHDG